MDRKAIFAELEAERSHQDKVWGSEFDDRNTINDWIAYLVKYLGRAISAAGTSDKDASDGIGFRNAIKKVAALCIAILERGAYAPRHYDR